MSRRQKIRIGDLLVQNKVIAESQLAQALAEQKKTGRKLGRVLIDLGFLDEDRLLEFLAQQLGTQLIDLKHFKFKAETVRLLPETHARRFRALVLAESQKDVLVGMADPTDIFAYDELARLLKKPVRAALVREADLLLAIDLVYRRTAEISTLAGELGDELAAGDYDLAQLAGGDALTDVPVIKLLQTLFEDALQVGASDIHIEPDEKVLRIRQRVDGVLQEQILDGARIAGALVTRLKLMSGLDISEKRLPQDGRFSIKVKHATLDVRLSTMPVQFGESVVMRLLNQAAGLLPLEQLGMPDEVRQRFERLIKRPSGMVLVTGPTGSGKTTTLYSALHTINNEEVKIITVEDPVEYRLPRINQVQVHPRIGLDFARVLRTALRQDPDVLMVGEMRDEETVGIGLRAAITGHLVFSTLHTNDAVATVTRLLDMSAAGYLLASALHAVLTQRLVRRVCDSCTIEHKPTPQQQAWITAQLGGALPAETAFRRGQGCTYCNNSGYRGRIGVYELLEFDAAMTDALRRSDSGAFATAAGQHPGYRPLVQSALAYAMEGVTSLDEVLRLTGDVEEE